MARPAKIDNVLSELFLRRGYARVIAQNGVENVWAEIVGEKIAQQTRVGSVKRGVLEVTVGSSLLVQELTFQKQELVKQLGTQLPQEKIRDLRFRVGSIQKRQG